MLPLELIVNIPLAVPAADGVKTVLKVAPCPELSVIGKLAPVMLKPPPVAAALVTVTLAPPVFVTVTGKV